MSVVCNCHDNIKVAIVRVKVCVATYKKTLCGRNISMRSVAMSMHATVTRLRRHMYNRTDLYREDTSKLHLLCKLLRSKKAKQGKFLYSSVSSPKDRSKRFTLYFPDRPIHSYTISASLGSIQPYATINARRMLVHISATVHSYLFS